MRVGVGSIAFVQLAQGFCRTSFERIPVAAARVRHVGTRRVEKDVSQSASLHEMDEARGNAGQRAGVGLRNGGIPPRCRGVSRAVVDGVGAIRI